MTWRSCATGLALLLLASLASCQKMPAMPEMPPLTVTVSQPVEREVTDYDDYEGRLAAVKTVEVRARVRGQLTKIFFKDGQLVKEGDQLFQIDPRPYQAMLDSAKAKRESAEAALTFAKQEYNRTARLVSSNAASREDLDQWRAKQSISLADKQGAEAEMEKAQLDLDFCDIRAPISGRTSRPLITEGNLINSGSGDSLLTTIVSIDPMYVYFDIDERAMVRYRRAYAKNNVVGEDSIKELKIPLAIAVEGDMDFTIKGIIDFVENRVNRGTGTLQVRGVVPNTGRLLDDGMRARVRVPVSDPYKALLITERAIGTDQTLKYVYIVNAKDEVERREVQSDRPFDGLIAIKSGLGPQDWVIVNGAQRVREGVKVVAKQVPMPGPIIAATEAPAPTTKR
jgi:membrane fusion protein, multidrug efflux system